MSEVSDRTNNTRDSVRLFMVDTLVGFGPDVDDKDLLEEHGLDSFAVAETVTFLQTAFGIPVLEPDVVENNFGTVERIVRFIENNSNRTNA